MDIQTRKIDFIQKFLKVQSEELISRLEELLKTSTNENDLHTLTIDELNERIDESMEDSTNNRVLESKELLLEIKQWQ